MLAFVGFIALLIFGKFLWDTYVTGKTDKDWDAYKKSEPEKAARITNSTTFDMGTDYKYNPIHQQVSLNMLASFFDCEASKVKEAYKKAKREELALDLFNIERFKEELKELKQQKYKQAVSMKFDPDNTPASFMERWILEVIIEFTQQEVSVERVLFKAHNLTCKRQYQDAIDLMSASYKMIENGRLVDENHLKPFLLNAIGECYLVLEDNMKALFFFEEAIRQVQNTSSTNEDVINKFIANKDKADRNYMEGYDHSDAEFVFNEFDKKNNVKKNIAADSEESQDIKGELIPDGSKAEHLDNPNENVQISNSKENEISANAVANVLALKGAFSAPRPTPIVQEESDENDDII